TVDLIEATGRHRGGMIVPSPALMVETLLSRTHGIRRRASGGRASGAALFGRSTREAIEIGSRYAAAALIDRAVAEARPLVGRRPLVVLTGGAAPTVRPLLQSLHVGVPDLVLRGLAVLAQGPVQRP
ncbi:MAG: type III pantothenate kinase, partial [Gammaproteobacteria bacterium]|nr:type III pantothenate kinase [Gammaproteobacteria bacterium]